MSGQVLFGLQLCFMVRKRRQIERPCGFVIIPQWCGGIGMSWPCPDGWTASTEPQLVAFQHCPLEIGANEVEGTIHIKLSGKRACIGHNLFQPFFDVHAWLVMQSGGDWVGS